MIPHKGLAGLPLACVDHGTAVRDMKGSANHRHECHCEQHVDLGAGREIIVNYSKPIIAAFLCNLLPTSIASGVLFDVELMGGWAWLVTSH